MYVLTNAMKNLVRNKGRNILIASIMLAIIASTVVTLTINNAAAKVIDEIKLEIGSKVEVRQDFIEMRQIGLDGRQDAVYISIDDFISFAESDFLSKSIFNADMYAWSDTLRAVGDYCETPGETTRINDNGEEVFVETCKLVSTSEPDALSEFGTNRNIVDGKMFSSLNECIISQELADLNSISVGDTIVITGAYAIEKTYRLTIVGIYSDTTAEYTNWMLEMNGRFADNRRNEIITSFETLIAAGWETNAGLDMKTNYYLRNPDEVTLFEAEVREKGLPITYNVSINQAAYDKVAGPLSSMKSATMTFMLVILILGVIVLALISLIAVRERKYEVGVLRAMGMGRGTVAYGILSESVIVAALCLALGLGAGSLVAQPIADGILARNVAASEVEDTGPNRVLFAGGQMQTDDYAEGYEPESEIQVTLNSYVVIQIIIIALSLAAISGIIGVVFITQYEPLKILRERN